MLKTRFEIIEHLYLFCASDNKSVLIKEGQALIFFYQSLEVSTQGMLESSSLKPFP